MSKVTIPALSSGGQVSKLAVLLDALRRVVISSAGRSSLTWLAGFEAVVSMRLSCVAWRGGAAMADQRSDSRETHVAL
jgi:hypothetical protein